MYQVLFSPPLHRSLGMKLAIYIHKKATSLLGVDYIDA